MAFKIAIASGKGGTGKTTVSVNLWHFFRIITGKNVQLIDCDVEEPNDLIFFPQAPLISEEPILQRIPRIDPDRCTFCRKCVEYCEFNAITVIPALQHATIHESLCHSCGACLVACTNEAIREYPVQVGTRTKHQLLDHSSLLTGILNVGSPQQTLVIRETKKHIDEEAEICLFDAPPGTSCPVVATVSDADYIVLVTEPTPFGLHDLKLMVRLLEELNKPFGVIVNKAGNGDNETRRYLNENKLEWLGDIPFSKEYAARYASGNLLKNPTPGMEIAYRGIIQKIETAQSRL
ncbi:MAG TPA: ATP-binding protein [Prolixibacteraceae bacterium]|nr:ATP-binding protein [Prolixibacteraceae bacterium]